MHVEQLKQLLLLNHGELLNRARKFGLSTEICSDEGITLETSAFQSLYGGQFTLSTPLINQIFVFHSPTDAAPQFLQKLTPFTHLLLNRAPAGIF